jgi:type IV secretory pathway TrbD component
VKKTNRILKLKIMKCNVGPVDRLIRIILGLIIAIVGVVFNSWWGLLGIPLIATGLFRCCLLYMPFNISTAKKEE